MKKQAGWSIHTINISLHIKLLAWLNIIAQVFCPLAVTFTPAIASTIEKSHLLINTEQIAPQTKIYTLSPGETTTSVAAKYNMTPEALQKLNQFRTFAHDFDHLQPKDEIDVPIRPQLNVKLITQPESTIKKNDAKLEKKIANHMSRTGNILANNHSGNAAISMANGIASSAANKEIQQWLSRFGTARVQLNADKNFSLKNSQLDLLIPLYKQKDSFVFTQGSIHRTDDRNQSNLGLGYRWFTSDWMLGGNAFVDYDLSRDHARFGLGIEYWRNFVKLGINSYHRLTSWKDSPDLHDYEERPASGWDIRMQAWLPALPQLGGKLAYEQYYGNQVALFGKSDRQKNPHAISAGITYTPVPLLTFSAEQRQGKSNKSDTQFGIEMNYQLGLPWLPQITPSAVAEMRSLSGNRYDLVERNNNILLTYRKKEVIQLKTTDLIKGYAGEQKSLGVSVNSKYGLDRIDWSAPSLIAAGGKIVQKGTNWTVVLPAYLSGTKSVNTYTVRGVAVDKKGNVSSPADTLVTVTQATIDRDSSPFSPSEVTLAADGFSKQQFILKINDSKGRPIDVDVNEINIEKSSKLRQSKNSYSPNATISVFSKQAAGEYTITVTAGRMPESFSITPVARNIRFASANITLVANNTTAMIDALNVVDDNAIADGKSENRFSIIIVDAQNNRVSGQEVKLKADNQASIEEIVTTGKDGTVIVPVTSQHAGKTTITANVNGKSEKQLKLTFLSDENTARIVAKDLTVVPTVSIADGKTKKTIKVKVTDAYDNPVPDMLITFSADNDAILSEKTAKTDAEGYATTTLTSTIAGISNVTARINQYTATTMTIFTDNRATAIINSVSAAEVSGIADGKTAITFRALVKDQNGNPLSDIPVDWKSNKDSGIVSFSDTQTLTSEQGLAETTVTSTRAYNDVVVTASTNASSQSASPFTFIADKQNPVITALTSNKLTLTANDNEATILTINVADANGNPLSGIKVKLTNSNQAVITPADPITDEDGVASASLTTHYAGVVNISATLTEDEEETLSLQAIADEKTADVSATSDTASAIAGQEQAVKVTATITDANNNPVSGTSVVWQADHNQLSHTVSQTNEKGEAVVELTGIQALTTTVTAILYNGNKDSTKINFGPGEPANQYSKLSISPQSITADGKSEALASLTLRDQWDNPVPKQQISWNADEKSGIHFTATEKGEGLYQASISGTAEGVWSLSASTGKVNLAASLGLLASQDSALIDSVQVLDSDTAKADGLDTITLNAQVKDKSGNTKLKGVVVGWDTNLGILSSRLSTTDENGIAQIKLSSHTAGLAQVSAILGGGEPVKADKSVRFTAGDISADKSTLKLSTTSIITGKESATVRLTVRDAEGNLLTDLKDKVLLNFSTDLDITHSTFSEISSGIYEATITGKKAGTTKISATVNDTRINHTTELTLRANNDSAIVKGSISVNPSSVTVGQTVSYSAKLIDSNGNPLGSGIPVTWSANQGSILSSQVTRTDDSGTASTTLTRQKTGTAKVNLILTSGSTSAPDVIFSAGEVDENRSELILSPSTIVAGKEKAILTLILRDSNGNLISGKRVSGISDNSHVKISESQQSSDSPGQYSMTISSSKAGSATLSVKVGDTTLSKTRTLTITGDTKSWKVSSITSDKTSLMAGDLKGVTYSATITDKYDNPLNDVIVSWQLRGQFESYPPTSRTDSKGVAKTTVLSTKTGKLEMTAWLDEIHHSQAKTVTVTAGEIKNSTFVADKASIGPDGTDAVTLTVYLEDSYGNPITGKTVTIIETDTLTGFTLSEVIDQKDGHYVATGTSTTKGKVTLKAQVDNKNVGNTIIVNVDAITPYLRFDNAEQSVSWTRNFTASQVIHGMPDDVEQKWSSSNRSIATVDGTGKVTLLKSGQTRISVYTPGDDRYNQAMASYTLKISKADPRLKAGTGEPITAVWADGKVPNITATYANNDVQDSLIISYKSKNTAIVTVDETGKLTAVKPGMTTVTVSTPETDQFVATHTDITYVLNKATIDVSFDRSVVKITDKETFSLQKPVTSLAPENSIKWTSSNTNVVNISDSGSIKGKVAQGQTRLTLSVLANDYYNASAGYYDVMVYTKPSISLGAISHISKGTQSSSKNAWTPVFTEDTLSVSWSADTSNEFSKPQSVTISIIDSNSGKTLMKKIEQSPSGSKATIFPPNALLWDKNIHVELIAQGYGTLKNKQSSQTISVTNLKPNQIWTSFTVRSYVKTVTSVGDDTACQESYFGREHNNYVVVTGDLIDFSGKTMISSMLVKGRIKATQNGSTSALGYLPDTYKSVRTDRFISFGTLLIAKYCWRSYSGGYQIGIDVNYNGKDYTYWASESHGWGGNGDGMYVNRIDKF